MDQPAVKKDVFVPEGLRAQNRQERRRAAKRAGTASKAHAATSPSKFTSAIPAPVYDNEHPLGDLPEGWDIEKIHEIAVLICKLCFDGKLRLPLAIGGDWQDQGIDLFMHDRPVARKHHCTFGLVPITTQPWRNQHWHGEWIPKRLVMLMEHYEDLLKVIGVEAGPPVLDRI